ncbi:WD repeat-containing protein 5 [Phytophthora cinnamomi]|uniref:WD repeat-containing protein 5 n=1 Tax=Phytophthora cinnamomi TaxID=4785 RepID=UPI00355A1141|nr:WD repeat-containing protein 5 [Phytophthora cinnamomi]
MALLLPSKIMSTHNTSSQPADPSALPLALIKKTPLLPSLSARGQLASMTKSFFAKAFPPPHRKLWGFQSSPTGVDDPTESASMAADEQVDDDAARGEICEIIVVAIQKVTDSGADDAEENDRVSSIGPGRLHKSSIWGSAKWSQGQLHLPHRVACTVRSGATTKVSAQPERSDNEFVFDEKFVFERREHDAQYHQVTIEVESVAPGGLGRKHRLGQVAVDLDAAFAAQAAGPIYRHSALTTADGSESSVEIHYVLHRLVVKNASAAAASRVLTRSSTSLNDDEDMDACGQIFPDLWYIC